MGDPVYVRIEHDQHPRGGDVAEGYLVDVSYGSGIGLSQRPVAEPPGRFDYTCPHCGERPELLSWFQWRYIRTLIVLTPPDEDA